MTNEINPGNDPMALSDDELEQVAGAGNFEIQDSLNRGNPTRRGNPRDVIEPLSGTDLGSGRIGDP